MISGAKGGGGSFKQTPDNLRSTDTFEGVLGLCIGPIKGPARGLKSIKLDGTPVENETGEMNFDDFTAVIGDGDPTKFPQPIQLKLGAGASPVPVNVSITNPNDGAGQATPGPWVVRTMNNTNADFIDIRFVVQQLYRQDKKGIYETTATLEIEMKPTGSTTWVNPIGTTPSGVYDPTTGMNIITKGQALVKAFFGRQNFNSDGTWKLGSSGFSLTGKTTGPSVYELRIAVPNEGSYADTGWDIRVRLLERDDYTYGDDGEKQEKRNISWESIAAVYGSTLGEHEDWRGLAWAQLYGKASDQLTGVPEIEGDYFTKIVSVPPQSVFNPDTRVYSGTIWDGSWAKAYTNDPAWVINDAISDSLSGLSLIAQGSYLNKWDALELSKWCSQQVPDGNGTGGTEPRYSLNIAVTEPQKAEEFIRYLGGAVGALLWDQGDGQWRCKVDKPEAPADIFTLDNIEGEFVYAHTDVDTRYNDIIGKFINEEMDYREDSVRLFDNPSIAQIGRKPTTIALVGCTGRQEAMRRVKLRLRSTVNEFKIVTFTTNRRGRNIEPLSTILVADGDLGDQDARTTGRITSIDAGRTVITVRDPMRLEQGVAYTLKFAKPNPNYSPDRTSQPGDAVDWKNPTLVYSRTVTNPSGARGNVTQLTLDSALPADIAEYMVVALEATGLVTLPKMFRVTNVTPADDGERITITAINIDTGKWDAADNVSKEDLVFQDLRGAPQPPTEIPGRPLLNVVTVPLEQGKQSTLQAAWLRPSGGYIRGFEVQYSINGGPMQGLIEQQMSDWELLLTQPGTYKVEIRTVSRDGQRSVPLVGTIDTEQNLYVAADIKYDSGESIEDLKPSEPGATNGMNPSEQALLDQLNQDIADAEALVSSIQSTVNSELAAFDTAISDVQDDMTSLQQSVSQDIQAIETEIAGISSVSQPNQLENGGFENGLTDWIQQGATNWSHVPNGASWGNHVTNSATGNFSLEKLAPAAAGGQYTLAADVRVQGTTGGTARLYLEFRDASSAILGTPAAGPIIPNGTDFDVTDASRKANKVTATAPAGTTQVTCKIQFSDVSGTSNVAVRRVKFERGDKATAFTSEASAYTAYTVAKSASGSVATLTSTVSTLNGTVTSQATSISNLNSSVSTLTNKVTAGSSPNLVKNGGFENTLQGWLANGQVNSGWYQQAWSWGFYARNTTPWTAATTPSYAVLDGQPIGSGAGLTYTLAAEADVVTTNTALTFAFIQLKCLNGAGQDIAYISAPAVNGNNLHFTADGSQRVMMTGTVTTPANTVTVVPRLVIQANAGITISDMNWRQVKVELGSIATPYSGEATASQMYSAYSTLNTSVSTLSTTVSTQGSSITSLQTSMTTANGNIATLQNSLVAGNPNMISNGSAENGMADWTPQGGSWNTVALGGNLWGTYFYANSLAATGADRWVYLEHTAVPTSANWWHTLTCDVDIYASSASCYAYVEMVFRDASNNPTGTAGTVTVVPANRGFSVDGTNRKQMRRTAASPVNTTKVSVRVVCYIPAGVTLNSFAFRQCKLELGEQMTGYSNEASISQSFTTLSSHTGSIASINSTLSTATANVSSLQSAMSTAQGDVATLKTRVSTGSGNILPNSSFSQSGWPAGWDWYTPYSGSYDTPVRDLAGNDWRPGGNFGAGWGEHVFGLRQNNGNTGDWGQLHTQRVPVVANKWYAFEMFQACHRALGGMKVEWYDSNNSYISTSGQNEIAVGSGGISLNGWTNRTTGRIQAPANAAFAVAVAYKTGTFAGQGDSYMWICRPMMIEVDANYVGPSPYVPSGDRSAVEVMQNSINGVLAQWVLNLDVNGYIAGMKLANNGQYSNFIINADNFQILKPGGGARTEYSGGNWRCYYANGQLAARWGVW